MLLETSVLCHWSISLLCYKYHAVLISVALYSSESVNVMPPALFLFVCLFVLLRIVLAMQALFWFHMKFKVAFSNSMKKVNGSLVGIALNL